MLNKLGTKDVSATIYQLRYINEEEERDMKAPIFGVTVIIGIVAVTLFFMVAQESQARPALADTPYHLYKLQYSYNNRIWHDLIKIENGNLSENMKYLRRQGEFPYLRYWYSYIDEEGIKRVQYIPLTVGGKT
ncbi:MAG TPA: hypothetical protein PLV78_03160 [Deltaproteobacteria bacterium]|nr:hypothetical protein [Deltaproteobacteria bacterium]